MSRRKPRDNPSLCGSQAYVVFDECDTDKSGTIGRAEGEVMGVT